MHTMSLYGAMMIGVSALDAFSNALSTSSSNIANVNTIGYKTGQTNFSTLVAASMGTGDMSSIGVVTSAWQNVGQQVYCRRRVRQPTWPSPATDSLLSAT